MGGLKIEEAKIGAIAPEPYLVLPQRRARAF